MVPIQRSLGQDFDVALALLILVPASLDVGKPYFMAVKVNKLVCFQANLEEGRFKAALSVSQITLSFQRASTNL
jgi:hypothetical protein